MKKLALLISFSLGLVICNGQTIQVEFSIENKLQKLDDDFNIYFVFYLDSAKYIVKPNIINNAFKVPDFKGAKNGNIIFKNKNSILGCIINLTFNQNMKIRFGYDKKPYNENYAIEGIESKEVLAIAYLMFMPQEYGEGTVTTISIINLDEYLKNCKNLLQ